jgi:hypothetical protein
MSARLRAGVWTAIAALVMWEAIPASSARTPAAAGSAPVKRITPSGVGSVKLHETYRRLRRHHLVAGITRGCELSGPRARSARLRPPLRGSVDFTFSSPRRVRSIAVTGGATARGVGVGASLADVRAAYPKATLDHSTDATFGISLVKVPRNGGGRLQFAVDTTNRKVTMIGIPFIAFCE